MYTFLYIVKFSMNHFLSFLLPSDDPPSPFQTRKAPVGTIFYRSLAIVPPKVVRTQHPRPSEQTCFAPILVQCML